jgi:hypothetical protein
MIGPFCLSIIYAVPLACAQLPGDINGDGFVGGTDLTPMLIVPLEPDTPATPSQLPFDADGDGDVDGDDFFLLLPMIEPTGSCTAQTPQGNRTRIRASMDLQQASGVSASIRPGSAVLCGEPTSSAESFSAAYIGLGKYNNNRSGFDRFVQAGYVRRRNYPQSTGNGVFLNVYTEFKSMPGPAIAPQYDLQFFSPAPPGLQAHDYMIYMSNTATGEFTWRYDGGDLYTYDHPGWSNQYGDEVHCAVETINKPTFIFGNFGGGPPYPFACRFASVERATGPNPNPLFSFNTTVLNITRSGGAEYGVTQLLNDSFVVWDIRSQ